MRKPYIEFMGNRKWFFTASVVLVVIGLAAILIRGLTFGIEFQGGTVMTFISDGKVTVASMREALGTEGVRNAEIQPVDGGSSFLVRTDEDDPRAANDVFVKVVTALKLPAQDVNVNTIGPGWGRNITDRAVLALALSIVAILLYISVRFEYKMSVTAVLALVHDLIITLGIYALVGREVTPNTVAALLTIMGYSLYDTIVVFHRIKENSQRLVKQTFMQMANDSINQVFVRWVNTGLASLIPVVVLFFFGGETLKDFAFALMVGLMAGAYSSVGLAAPLYAVWKETEPKYRALVKKFAGAAS